MAAAVTQLAAAASDNKLRLWPLAAAGPGEPVSIDLAAVTKLRHSRDGA